MNIRFASLVDQGYPVLGLDDAAADAARLLIDRGISMAPVLDGERYLGMATLSGLMAGKRSLPSAKSSIRTLSLASVPAFAEDALLIDGLHAMVSGGNDVVPVTGGDGKYLGVVTRRQAVGILAGLAHVDDASLSLVIEAPSPGIRLSAVIAAIEKNDAVIVSFSTMPAEGENSGQFLLFRVLAHDFFRLVRNLENYGYLVSFHSPFPDFSDDEMREKALEFIRYIDM